MPIMTTSNILMVSAVGYLLGAINFAVIVARSQGVDILKVGSGNPGATNVTRALGSKFGKLVFALDALKGFVAAYWPLWLISESGLKLAILGLVASIIGHSFLIFFNFLFRKIYLSSVLSVLSLSLSLSLFTFEAGTSSTLSVVSSVTTESLGAWQETISCSTLSTYSIPSKG